MYPRDSVVSKASTVGPETSPTPPVIFTRGQNVRNLASFLTSLKFEPPAFYNAAIYLNTEANIFCCINDLAMPPPSLNKLGSRIPKHRWVKVPTPKIAKCQ